MVKTIRLDFFSKTIKQDLAELPEKMLEGAFEAINEAADLIKGLAQVNVAVDTGSLRNSIRKERGGIGKRWRVVRVRAGGYVTNPKTKKIVNYAAIIEERYPFLGPAVRSVMPQVRTMIENKVMDAVEK